MSITTAPSAGPQTAPRRKLRVFLGLFLAALALFAVSMSATGARAATAPPVKVYASVSGWNSPSVKPAAIEFGQGGSPFINGLHWQWWYKTAYATGRLWTVTPGCTPLYQCPYHSHWMSVHLTTVRVHGTVRYFSTMTVKFWHNGAWRQQTAYFRTLCSTCTAPSWVGPNAWPYL
jgi:hypothetical protein